MKNDAPLALSRDRFQPGWWGSLPAWLRWSLIAAAGLFVLAIVQSVSGTSQLTAPTTSSAMLRWAMPILLAGLGGLFSERCGVVNIGLEGMMILGTWFGAWGSFNWGPWGGLLAGLIGGALGGLLHAIATVQFGVDHIISGVAINILAPGVTRYLSERIFTGYAGGSVTQSPRVEGLDEFTMPILAGGKVGSWESPDALGWIDDQNWFVISDLAGLVRGLMLQLSWFTAIGLILVALSSFVLWRTRVGLRMRISGENPWAGESLGVNIYGHKYLGVVVSGALAGLAGAFIVLELTGIYREGQTNGRGFIALAALIFGNWRASGVLVGSLVFGYPFGLSLRDLDGTSTRSLLLVIAIALVGVAIWAWTREKPGDAGLAASLAVVTFLWYVSTSTAPDWLPNTMPFVLVLLVLIFASQRLRPPAADGIPYRRGET